MKKITLTLMLLTFLNQSGYSQVDLHHHLTESISSGNFPQQMGTNILTNDGGTLVITNDMYVGTISPTTYGVSLIKYDSQGIKLWNKFIYGFTGMNIKPSKAFELADGSFMIAGNYSLSFTGSGFILKVSSTGDPLFIKTLAGYMNDIVVDSSDNGYVLALNGNSALFGGNLSGYIIKMDADGNILWNHKANYTNNNDYFTSAIRLNDGNYMAIGYSFSVPSAIYGDGIVAKYSSSGALLWTKSYTTTNKVNVFRKFHELADGSIMISGSQSTFLQPSTGMITKIDSAGNLLWSNVYGTGVNAVDYLHTNNLIYSFGQLEEPVTFIRKSFVAQYSEAGNLNWIRFLAREGQDTQGLPTGVTTPSSLNIRQSRISFSSVYGIFSMDSTMQASSCYTSDSTLSSVATTVTVNIINPTQTDTSSFNVTFPISGSSAIDFIKSDVCNLSTGLEQQGESKQQLSLFPNPAADVIILKVSQFTTGLIYSITDYAGRKLLEGNMQNELTEIDVSKLSAGSYLVVLYEKIPVTIKLIKL